MTQANIDYDAFAAEIRAFALENCPPDIRAIIRADRKLTREPWSRWQKILFEKGWGAPGWPTEYGGTGWDVRQRYIFDEVTSACECPPLYHHGLRHIGPVLIEFGTAEQKARYLPGILDGSDWWCQGYSEPGSGSDLASLKTRATRRGDVYVVDGQKIWTSHAHEADLMYTLVRTSSEGRKQEGITLLLIPMDTPGVSVRPIRTIDGWHHINEVFLDGVEVPVANRVGEEGKGWGYGKFLLERERLGAAQVSLMFRMLERTRDLVARELPGAVHARRREQLEYRLLAVEAELVGQRELGLAAIEDVMHDRPLGLAPSSLKLSGSRLTQEIGAIAFEVVGPRLATRFPAVDGEAGVDGLEWVQTYLYGRARSILGGTSEIQKNVIARSLFGA